MPFTGVPSLSVPIPDLGEPIEFFHLLFEDSMFNSLVEETNRYVSQRIDDGSHLKAKSRLHRWQPVAKDEMHVFMALVINMGLVYKSDIADYWTTEETTSTPFFGKMMTRDRFLAILSNLHLVDNALAKPSSDPSHDRLFKIRPMISMLRRTFTIYSPERDQF